ncbi:MAG: hypothetical protein ABIR33_10920 [Pyrinomonadaceae bacterium]
MQSNSRFRTWLFAITFALIFYGLGASFVESFVNYPTWRLIGAGEFLAYHNAIGPLVIGYMVIPMVLTTVLTILLAWFRPLLIPRWALWLSVILQMLVWISTATIQIPIQMELSKNGLSLPLIEQLIFTNFWFRKVPQIINIFLFLWMMSLMLRSNTEPKTEV